MCLRLRACTRSDGTVRQLDVGRREFVTLYASDRHELSAFALAPSGDTVWLGTNQGHLGAIDARSHAVAVPFAVRHARKANTLSLDAAGRDWLLASASTDASVRVWDVRRMGSKPLVQIDLPKASQAAEWAPDGSCRLAVTCFDDHLRIFDLSGAAKASGAGAPKAASAAAEAPSPKPLIKHVTQTGRWVVPFRTVWTAKADGVIVGGMKRSAEVYDAHSGRRVASLRDEKMTAIPSRNAAHPNGSVLACATNSGRVHLFDASREH